jgi:hypothetical protein
VPATFRAVVVIVIALLPGAPYVWAFERQAGRYGIGLSDRILRFVGGSAVLLAVFAGPLYVLHVNFTRDVAAGRSLPWWLVAVPLAYVGVPLAAGTVLGVGLRRGWQIAKVVAGPIQRLGPGTTCSSTTSTAGSVAARSREPGSVVRTPTPTASGRTPRAIPSHKISTLPPRLRSTPRPESSHSTTTADHGWDLAVCSSGGRRWSTLSSSTPEAEGGQRMAGKDNGSRRTGSVEKRGGYGSSSKPASSLKPPPSGPAPGAAKQTPRNSGSGKGK